jgi:hypothetical protein
VNTSNHALAEHDNNGERWKFEFVADDEDCSILMGSVSRENLEHTFQSKYEVIYEIGKLIEKEDLLKDEEIAASRCVCFAKRQYLLNERMSQELVRRALSMCKRQASELNLL